MENIHIDLGAKRFSINGDPNKVIEINPDDALFVERFYKMYQDFNGKQVEFTEKAKALEGSSPQEQLDMVKEIVAFMHSEIDKLIGPGTSAMVFGASQNLKAIAQFLDGLTDGIQGGRAAKIEKHLKRTRKVAA